jgi:hypothetical protein
MVTPTSNPGQLGRTKSWALAGAAVPPTAMAAVIPKMAARTWAVRRMVVNMVGSFPENSGVDQIDAVRMRAAT